MALQIDASALTSASGKYSTQKSIISNSGSSLSTVLKLLTEKWNDAAGEELKSVAADLRTEIDSIVAKMEVNAKLLSATSQSATELQSRIQAGVQGL